MHIAILTFDGFNEIDSFVALNILNRVKRADWRVSIVAPTETVTSMNGVKIHRQASLLEASDADAVIIGSGIKSREIAQNAELMAQLALDPTRQLIGAQCSGALILNQLNLLHNMVACTDSMTKPWVEVLGIEVLNQAFFAHGNVATAGGCLGSQYLAAWILARTEGIEAATEAIHYVAPVGEKEAYVERMLRNITPYLPQASAA